MTVVNYEGEIPFRISEVLNEDVKTGALSSILSGDQFQPCSMPREVEEGNVEYKRHLASPDQDRFEQLVSQLKYRLTEGNGEALYELGVEDDGKLLGIPEDDLDKSIATLRRMAASLGAEANVIFRSRGSLPDAHVAEVVIRLCAKSEVKFQDIRIAVAGNVDSGKSTLVGVLAGTGGLDDGRGKARSAVFVHKHEMDTGRTSSVSHQIMGFDGQGNIVNHAGVRRLAWKEIVEKSSKVMTFLDLAGHEKYLKTTVGGLMGSLPDFCLLAVGANMGVTRMTKEHLDLALALQLPLFTVLTKIDIAPDHVKKHTLQTISQLLKHPDVGKMPYLVKNEQDVFRCAKSVFYGRVVPVFLLSCVTGEGVSLLTKFLNLLSPRNADIEAPDAPAKFQIDETFNVPGVGTVVSGLCVSGTIVAGTKLLFGPDSFGNFEATVVKSIHNKRVPLRRVVSGQSGALALKKVKRSQVRKGMMLLAPELAPRGVWSIKASIRVLNHSTTIQTGYQAVVHIGNVRQCARIRVVQEMLLRNGDEASVFFDFMYRPEYVREGANLVFREGRTKGIGFVAEVFTDRRDDLPCTNRTPSRVVAPPKSNTALPLKPSQMPSGKHVNKKHGSATTAPNGTVEHQTPSRRKNDKQAQRLKT
eukprot:Rmarinus@m.12992